MGKGAGGGQGADHTLLEAAEHLTAGERKKAQEATGDRAVPAVWKC